MSGPPRLRVAFDTTATLLTRGGQARYALELAAALERLGDVELVRVAHRDRPRGGRAGRVLDGLDRELVFYPRRLDRLVRAAGARLLHCPGHAAPRTGVPFVLSVHDVLPLRHPELFTTANSMHFRTFVAPAARRAAAVLTGSMHVRDQIVELLNVPPEQIFVTPYGVSDQFRPSEPAPAWLERRFGIRGPYLLTVGADDPRKNVTAAVRLAGGRQVVVVGPAGWKAGRFDEGLRATPNVVITDHVPDDELISLYGGATCFLYLSLDEGFGLPPLEAMACGCPVLASARGPLPEVLGTAAILVEPDAEEATAALDRVLQNDALRADMTEKGLERARMFSWEACARATTAVYETAIAEGGGQAL